MERSPHSHHQTTNLDTGVVVSEVYQYRRQRHRDSTDGPALIKRHPQSGVVTCEKYYEHGVLHRLGGPALIYRHAKTGVILSMVYCERGEEHREGGPAVIEFHAETGTVRHERYCYRNVTHRSVEEGPAETFTQSDGIVTYEEYTEDGEYHRDGKPAVIYRSETGEIDGERWFRHGELHRPFADGPASWDGHEQAHDAEYWDVDHPNEGPERPEWLPSVIKLGLRSPS